MMSEKRIIGLLPYLAVSISAKRTNTAVPRA